jgi:hypothetical protein
MGAAIVVTMIALSACDSDADKRRQAETNLQSWDATVQVVGEQWVLGHAPGRYSRAALDRAQQAIQQELSALPTDTASEPLRARGRDTLGSIAALRAAVERGDTVAGRAILAR